MPTINVNQALASETAKGIVEEATQAEVNAGTDTGGTGAKVFVAPSKLIASSKWATKADLVGGTVPQSQLPSYVDDILEFANFAAFPVTGETGKIYIAIDTGKQYRWSGSAYVQISNGFIATTDDVPEGSTNLYFTQARVRTTPLTGFSVGSNTPITATHSVATAFADTQAQINARPNETATTIATINHGTAAKTSLVDTDEITGQDSASSFSLIRTTWTNVKAFLKTYFDTLYAAKTFVESISLQDSSTGIVAQTYTLELYAAYAYTINELKIISESGTCTAAVKIGSTSVTGISAVSVSSTIATGTASAANTVAVGDKITLVISSPSSLNNLQASLKTTRI